MAYLLHHFAKRITRLLMSNLTNAPLRLTVQWGQAAQSPSFWARHLRLWTAALLAILLLSACSLTFDDLRSEARAPALPSLTAPLPLDADNEEAIVVVTWNVGLGDADVQAIADQMAAMDGVDLWLLQESGGSAQAQALEAAAEAGEDANFAGVQGTTGSDIPLLTLYNAGRFALLGSEELHAINVSGTVRAPLVLHLRDSESGAEFLLLNNHLYRSEEDQRDRQATLLNEWAQTQTLPILAGGDHNFDYDVPDGPAPQDRGFANMTANEVFRWVPPQTLAPTQCTDSLPCRYDDILDFLFVAGPARAWGATSEVIVRQGDFPDNAVKSDHRPVVGWFVPALE